MGRIKRIGGWAARMAPSRHYYRALEGIASHVRTHLERAFLKRAASAVKECGVLVATGRPGTGKTHGVAMLVEMFPEAVYLAITPSTTGQQVMQALYVALNQQREHECPSYLVGDPLQAEVTRLLVDERRPLIIDDANFMGDKLVEHFIFLQTYGEFPLLILGHGLGALVGRNEALRTRITHRHAFRRMTGDRLWQTLADYHPCFAISDREALEFIDTHYARGVFRCWATVLHKIIQSHPAALETGVTATLAKSILHEITGDRYGDQPRKAA